MCDSDNVMLFRTLLEEVLLPTDNMPIMVTDQDGGQWLVIPKKTVPDKTGRCV